MWRIRRNVRSMKEYHLNTKMIKMYKFQQFLLRIIPQTLQFSRKRKEAMSQDYFSGKYSLARLSCILQSFSSKSDRQDTIFATISNNPFDLVARVSLLPGKKGDPGNEVAVLCFNRQLALRGHVASFVTWFCLQNTISGSSLKHNNSDLVFQTHTICLKWESP